MMRRSVARARYEVQQGDRVEFLGFGVPDPYSRLEVGTLGTVRFVDDLGTVHVKWDSGSELGLVVGLDRYRVVSS